METERYREPLLPVRSLEGWDTCWRRDRALVEEGMRGCTAMPQALIDQGDREALNSEASLNHNNRKKQTPTHPRTYPSVKSTLVTQASQKSTREVTHKYKEAHTFPQTCWHSGIVALTVISPVTEGPKPTSSIRVAGGRGLVILGGTAQVQMKESVEGTL